jgi:EmrB/QacA subfamily drug resistance transporter
MPGPDASLSSDPLPLRHRAVLPYIVAATFFMEYLDTTIIATALPAMARSFSVGPNEVSLGMTAYMLTLAVFIPISGWIADRYGSRSVFAAAVAIFVVASVACGFSTGLAWFIASRVLQGIGGAMMVPVGRVIVIRNTEKSRLMQAIATIIWPGILAPVIGPSLGGFITTYASWQWIFFLNVPFGLAALAAIFRFVPNQRQAARRAFDRPGFLLSGAALICLMYGTELASHQEVDPGQAIGFMLAGLMIGAVAVRHAHRATHPLLDLSTLRVPTYSVTVLWGSATRIGIESVPYLSPLLFQIGFGLSPFRSGLLLLASALGNLSMKFCTTRILRRFGFRAVMSVNCMLVAAFAAALGWLQPSTPLAVTIVLLFVYGLTRSLQFTSLSTLAYSDIDEHQKGPASTLWSVAQQMTIGMGIAFGAMVLRIATALRGADTTRFVLADFRIAFTVAGALALASAIGYLRLRPNAGDQISGRV